MRLLKQSRRHLVCGTSGATRRHRFDGQHLMKVVDSDDAFLFRHVVIQNAVHDDDLIMLPSHIKLSGLPCVDILEIDTAEVIEVSTVYDVYL